MTWLLPFAVQHLLEKKKVLICYKMHHFFTFVTPDSAFNKAVTPRQPTQPDSILFRVGKAIRYRVRSVDERGAVTKHTLFSPSCRCADSEADVPHPY